MSTPIFPDLPGLAWGMTRKCEWPVAIDSASSGLEARTIYQTLPKWHWELEYSYLRDYASQEEMQTLAGFYMQMFGGFTSFFLRDGRDNTVTNQFIANGNGSETDFQLSRTWVSYQEPVFGIDTRGSASYGPYFRPAATALAVRINGTPTSDYTANNDTGVISFGTPPNSGDVITADFSYFFRCRFEDSSLDFDNIFSGNWEVKKLRMVQTRS